MILSVLLHLTFDELRPPFARLGVLSIWIGILFLQTRKTYFSIVSSFILTLSLVGFADNLIFDVGQPSNFDPKFVVHGLFSLAWMIAFAVQADLVRTGRTGLHKKVGIAGFLAAVGFIVSTLYLFYVLRKPWAEMRDIVQVNRVFVPSYAVLLVLAWRCRFQPEHHKRMVLMGTLYLLLSIINRVIGGLPTAELVLWNGLFVSLFVYDWITSRKIHVVTYSGFAWFCLGWAIVVYT